MSKSPDAEQLASVLNGFPAIQLAVLFGSVGRGSAGADSDIDVAIQGNGKLTLGERIAIIEAIALAFNRPVDLVDIRTTGQPLLHQIVSTGRPVIGTRQQWGDLIYRNIMENEDFVPYQQRILEGRRNRWINNS